MVDDPTDTKPGTGVKAILSFARVWLQVGLVVVGLILCVVGHGRTGVAAVGVCLILIALSVWLINLLFRLSVSSNRDRERDEEARDYYDRYGHWPGEEDR